MRLSSCALPAAPIGRAQLEHAAPLVSRETVCEGHPDMEPRAALTRHTPTRGGAGGSCCVYASERGRGGTPLWEAAVSDGHVRQKDARSIGRQGVVWVPTFPTAAYCLQNLGVTLAW